MVVVVVVVVVVVLLLCVVAKAIGRLKTIAKALGPDRTRTELIPFLNGMSLFLGLKQFHMLSVCFFCYVLPTFCR